MNYSTEFDLYIEKLFNCACVRWLSLRQLVSDWLEPSGHLVIFFPIVHLLPLFFAYLHKCISWLTAPSRVNILQYDLKPIKRINPWQVISVRATETSRKVLHKLLKSVDQIIYLASNILSTENGVSIRVGKAWIAIDREIESLIRIKWDFFQAVLLNGGITWTLVKHIEKKA